MKFLDWTILAIMYFGILAVVVLTKQYMRGVTDYLAAGRSAGRYLLTISAGIAGLGAITVVANMEMGYEAGFADLVAELRTRHPHATLVVTGRGSTERWGEEVRAAGADVICSWPVPYAMLSQVLHTRRDAAAE